MILNWRWFLGGKAMFWITIIFFIFIIIAFIFTYFIDVTSLINIKPQKLDTSSIIEISEGYVSRLGITIDKPIVYKFVHFRCNDEAEDEIVLGTFHEWNNTYYINISADLYRLDSLNKVVVHETRHMIIEYLNDKNIINLVKYTEEIAQGEDVYYNNLFNSGVYLLKKEDKND